MNTTATPAKSRRKTVNGQATLKKITPQKTPANPQKTPAPTRALKTAQVTKRKSVQAARPPSKQPTEPVKANKDKKIKVVRDSFTLPKTELLQITEMKKRAMALGVEVKKSELIRAGLQALAGMTDTAFKKAMANVPTIKTGRPVKD